ncbi:MAG: restriction endonuclease subunit S, partial [Desulfobacterales bacterium]|nr:restriction endonuclease subunit S [Desulfobacterales bacterium]
MASDWMEYCLSALGEIKTGKTPPGKIKDAYGGDTPFITPRDMDGRKWSDTTERYLSESGLGAVKNSLVPPRGVAVSCIGSDMGKVVMVAKPSVTNQQINTIIVDEEKFNAEFVYYNLSTRQDELKGIASGSATPILNKGHFSNVKVLLPNRKEQDTIVDILCSIDDKIELNRQINQTLEQIAQAIFKAWLVDFEPIKATI